MRVVVKTLAGESYSITTDAADCAADLLASAAAATGGGAAATGGGAAAASSLVFLGRVLDDAEGLGAAGVQEGSVLILARRRARRSVVVAPAAATGGARVALTIKRVGTEAAPTTVTVGRSAALDSVAEQLKAEWGVGAVRLVHGGRVLHPDATVSEVGLSDGMTLFGMASAAAVAPAAAAAAAAALNGSGSDDDEPPGGGGGGRSERPGQGESEVPTCRICHCGEEVTDELGPLFSPCMCAGTMQHVHVECLNRWRRMSANPTSYFACDSCGYRYQMNRTRWAGYVESRAATEIATALMCALMVCSAALPSYWLSVHTHFVRILTLLCLSVRPPSVCLFAWLSNSRSPRPCCVCGCGVQYSLCSLDPYWRTTTWESTLDCFLAGLVGTSGVFYSLWLYSLYESGQLAHLSHLGLTVAANGTRIFRLLALSGSLMAWRAVHAQVRQATAVLMQRFGEQLREASAHAAPQPQGGRHPQPNGH